MYEDKFSSFEWACENLLLSFPFGGLYFVETTTATDRKRWLNGPIFCWNDTLKFLSNFLSLKMTMKKIRTKIGLGFAEIKRYFLQSFSLPTICGNSVIH